MMTPRKEGLLLLRRMGAIIATPCVDVAPAAAAAAAAAAVAAFSSSRRAQNRARDGARCQFAFVCCPNRCPSAARTRDGVAGRLGGCAASDGCARCASRGARRPARGGVRD